MFDQNFQFDLTLSDPGPPSRVWRSMEFQLFDPTYSSRYLFFSVFVPILLRKGSIKFSLNGASFQ